MLLIILSFLLSLEMGFCQLSRNKEELMNWCLNSTSHKNLPGKEDVLHKQCLPWKEKACCTEEKTVHLHERELYNFTLNHCYEETGRNLSKKCREYFDRDNCFYECEPHIGFWVVKTKRKISTERFYKVPLCASDCDSWFEACKDDLTCAYNWPKDFKFTNGVNSCRRKCITFQEMYMNSKNFCENVYDHSWVYTSDDKPCMRTWFNSSLGNPNKDTAESYIDDWLNGASIHSSTATIILLAIGLIFTLC